MLPAADQDDIASLWDSIGQFNDKLLVKQEDENSLMGDDGRQESAQNPPPRRMTIAAPPPTDRLTKVVVVPIHRRLAKGRVPPIAQVIRCWRHRGCRGPVAIASVPVRKSGAGVKLGTLKFIEKTVKKIAYGFAGEDAARRGFMCSGAAVAGSRSASIVATRTTILCPASQSAGAPAMKKKRPRPSSWNSLPSATLRSGLASAHRL
ncbi:hypothetical protein EJB05_41909, partial [Eragrostis curvula]